MRRKVRGNAACHFKHVGQVGRSDMSCSYNSNMSPTAFPARNMYAVITADLQFTYLAADQSLLVT